jgi:hypothetical protein
MEPISDYRERALASLPAQYRGKPFIEAIVAALADEVQAVEADREALEKAFLISTSTGYWLEVLEKIVGAPLLPGGTGSDLERRAVLLATAAANASHGGPWDLRGVLEALGLRWGILPWRFKASQVVGPDPVWIPAAVLGELLSRIVPAGNSIQVQTDPGGFAIVDQDLLAPSLDAWQTTGGTLSKPFPGVLRLDGRQDFLAYSSAIRIPEYGSYTWTGEARGTIRASLGFDHPLIGDLRMVQAEPVGDPLVWVPFSRTFTVALGAALPALPAIEGWWEVRNLRLAPAGRLDRSFRWGSSASDHVKSSNGWGSISSVSSDARGLWASLRTF